MSCATSDVICKVPITFTKDVTKPIYFFIEVSNLNQIMYPIYESYYTDQIKSKVISTYTGPKTEPAALDGVASSAKEPLETSAASTFEEFTQPFSDACGPIVYNSALEGFIDIEALNLSPDEIAIPCGLLPRYYPSDRFTAIENIRTGTVSKIFRTGVWDKNYRYQYDNMDPSYKWWMNITDPRFPVWMKYRSTMTTSKQWGIGYNDLTADSYYLHVNITYDASLFNGEKWVTASGNTNSYSTRVYGVIILLGILAVAIVIIYALLLKAWLGYHASRPKN